MRWSRRVVAVMATGAVMAVAPVAAGASGWHRQASFGGVEVFNQISCPSVHVCFAAGVDSRGAFVVSTANGGVTWSRKSLHAQIQGGGTLGVALACLSARRCWVAGNTAGPTSRGVILATTNGGRTWHSQKLPRGVAGINVLACTPGSQCMALGDTASLAGVALVTHNGGQTWMKASVPRSAEVELSIACGSRSHCWASDGGETAGLILTTDGGQHWHTRPIAAPANQKSEIGGLTCPTSSECIGVSDEQEPSRIVRTTNGGSSWATVRVPAGEQILAAAVTCASKTRCWALGEPSILSTSDGGATWTTQALPSGLGGFGGLDGGIACASKTHGWAVGVDGNGHGLILATSTGGN